MKQLLLLLSVICISCESEITSDNSVSGQMKGDVVGYVTYYDTVYTDFVGNNIRKPLSDATIQVEGTSFSAVTDSNGRWEIHGLPAGIYSVACSKPGYATVKDVAFSFVGNGTDVLWLPYSMKIPHYTLTSLVTRAFEPYRIRITKDSLYMLPDSTFTTVTYYDSVDAEGLRTVFSCGLGESYGIGGTYPFVSMFFASDSNMHPEKPASYKMCIQEGGYDHTISPGSTHHFKIFTDELKKNGFRSGEEVYCAVYVTLVYGKYCGYLDLATGRTAYTGYQKQRIVKRFVLP